MDMAYKIWLIIGTTASISISSRKILVIFSLSNPNSFIWKLTHLSNLVINIFVYQFFLLNFI